MTPRYIRRLMAITFLACLASLVPMTGGATPAEAKGGASGPRTAQTAQYHRLSARQYHEIAPAAQPDSAWLREAEVAGSEFGEAISTLVISRSYSENSAISPATAMIHRSSKTRAGMSRQNESSIGTRIGDQTRRDPRVMLQIGAVLGLLYSAFLAIWFWATRLRMRPPSGASP